MANYSHPFSLNFSCSSLTHTVVFKVFLIDQNIGLMNFMTSTSSLIPTPDVVFTPEDGQVCIRCILTPNINACILIVHTTFDMGRELYVYVINRSNVSECFFIGNFKEFNIAVFGLLHDGLERKPTYANFVRGIRCFDQTSTTIHIIDLFVPPTANNSSDIGMNPPPLASPAIITAIGISV